MNFEEKEYKVFELFQKQWALVTAGNMEKFNSCTVSWGSMGTLWTRPGKTGSVITAGQCKVSRLHQAAPSIVSSEVSL